MPVSKNEWIDSSLKYGHSDLIPEPLKEIAGEIIPRLTNLKAFDFEIMPEYLQAKKLSADNILAELEFMKEIWRVPKKEGLKKDQIQVQSGSCPNFGPAK